MQTWHIHIEGRVQGVGFRPGVKRLADNMKLTGEVSNTTNGVHINLNCTSQTKLEFIERLKMEMAPAARITAIHCRKIKSRDYAEFRIAPSKERNEVRLLVTPDLALCDKCRADIENEKDRRYQYAFTTCTNCGPRYSVMKTLPYDRETTTMKPFVMCPSCEEEYNSTANRRYYSQTNSCPECGIKLKWLTKQPEDINPVWHAVKLLGQGKIVAVKGIGGFLILADASNKRVVELLRERKQRPKKPFACMVKSIAEAKKIAQVNSREAQLLTSAEAPIVLLKLRTTRGNLAYKSVAPGLNRIGLLLPYAPLLQLIADKADTPLIATSANVTGSPIVFKDEDAVRLLSGIADAILSNNRAIHFPQDDSVVALTDHYQKTVFMRRSRGYAPSLTVRENCIPNHMLAMGAEMKSAFGLTNNGLTYLSQYLGHTSTYESQESYNQTLKNLINLIKPDFKHVVVDKHPNYHTTQKGERLATKHKLPIHRIQHHKAHFASVLCEHDLVNSTEPILGVVWDGTGYGDDKAIWGGEFFSYKNGEIDRIFHLGYTPVLGGDRMAKNPPWSTYAFMYPDIPGKVWARQYFSNQEQEILPQMAEVAKLKTSSMGRFFDAVAGLLNLTNENTFEGEAAMLLEAKAEKSKLTKWQPYCLALKKNTLNAKYIMQCILDDLHAGACVEDLALRFHQTLVQWIAFVAGMRMMRKIAFSGGVFQNTLLVDLIIERLGAHHDLYFHNILPPNDENVAIGQMALAGLELNKEKDKQTKQELCV